LLIERDQSLKAVKEIYQNEDGSFILNLTYQNRHRFHHSNFYLTAIAVIRKKYKTTLKVVNKDCAIPVLSNQSRHAYLKENCRPLRFIKKNLHHAPKPVILIATTVTRQWRTYMKRWEEMLGHKNLRLPSTIAENYY